MKAEGLSLKFKIAAFVDIDICAIQDEYNLWLCVVSKEGLCKWTSVLVYDLFSGDVLEPKVFFNKVSINESRANDLNASSYPRL